MDGQKLKQNKKINIKNIKIIPYPIDKKIFKPISQIKIRKKLKINTRKKIGLFITATHINDPRKGFDLLQKSLQKIKKKNFELFIVGSNTERVIINHSYFSKNLTNSKYEVAKIINCSDFLLFPSKADNLPNVVLESLACNKPVVAYDIGGVNEVIKHKFNGYLAKPFNKDDFSQGITYVLKTVKLSNNISKDKYFKKHIDENRIKKNTLIFQEIINN